MKISEMRLLAFGPFTDVTLDFTSREKGLNIIFGPNEAGKSSFLRAVKALFFGIPPNTGDNFVHEYGRMRLRARLCLSDGSELDFTRRKGNKGTILDPNGITIDESVLDRFLSGVSGDVFSTVFCINHDALVRGGKDILQEKGGIGQSLFAAGLGNTGLNRVLSELKSEAGSLFKAGGEKPSINKSIKEFHQTQQTIREASVSSHRWEEQRRDLEEAEKRSQAISAELQLLIPENMRLNRLYAAIPKISKREGLLTRLRQLGDVVVLPTEFRDRRKESYQRLLAAENDKTSCIREIAQLEDERNAISVPELVLANEREIIELHQRLGSHQKAAADIKNRLVERRQLIADANSLKEDLPSGESLEKVFRLDIDVAQRARIRDLGRKHEPLRNSLERAKKDLSTYQAELVGTNEILSSLTSPGDASDLRRAIAYTQNQGDLASTLRDLTEAVQTDERKARLQMSRLGLWRGSLEEMEEAPVPSAETVNRFEEQLGDLQKSLSKVEDLISNARKELKDHEEKMQEVLSGGEVPSENELGAARARRDSGWELVRRAWLEAEDVIEEQQEFDPENDLATGYETSVRFADELADRLRTEADRVAEMTVLIIARDKCLSQISDMEKGEVELRLQMDRLNQRWVDIWHPLGIEPLTPREMRAWLLKQNELIVAIQKMQEGRRKLEQTLIRIDECREKLTECIGVLGESTNEEESLEGLLHKAQALAENIDELGRQQKAFEKQRSDLIRKIAEAGQEVEKFEADWICWQSDWTSAVSVLGLTSNALPSEADAVLDKLEEISKKLREAESLSTRILDMERDAKKFRADVKNLLEYVAPDLQKVSPEQAVEILHSRLMQAKNDSASLSQLQKQLDKRHNDLKAAEENLLSETKFLQDCCLQAHCSKYEELDSLEDRSIEYQNVCEKLRDIEEQLTELTGGSTIENLISEAREVSADSLPQEISQNDEKTEDLRKEQSKLDQDIGGMRQLFMLMDGNATVALAAEKAQSILAEIQVNVERYVRVQLAHSILQREIERYRLENQIWLVERAGAIFRRITLNSFHGLQIDSDDRDEAVLCGVRPSRELLKVENMSDGTRDQLYLSLRLASLDRYFESNEPIPFIVDDILINFDDGRAEATLEVLAELSRKTQILFFTHHSRLVDLARNPDLEKVVMVHALPDSQLN